MYTTMSIASFGSPTVDKPPKRGFLVKETNRMDDIDGAKPKKFCNSPMRENTWQKDDIAGTKSIKLHWERTNGVDRSLKIDDIDGTRPLLHTGMARTTRRVDPLQPTYTLPSYTEAPPVVPKAAPEKEAVDTKDAKRVYATKLTNNIDDIVGSKPGWRPDHVQARYSAPPYPIMECQDISKQTSRYVDRTSRSTNSLDPVYHINGETIDTQFKPSPSKPYIEGNHLLQTKDILGAYPGWTPNKFDRREFRNTNHLDDIKGAKADSIKHGITTNRSLHPLQPYYPSLDGEVLPPCTVPLLPEQLFNKPKLRQSPIKPSSSLSRAGSSSCGLFSPVRTPSNGTVISRTGSEAGDQTQGLSLAINLVKSSGASPQVTGGRSGRQLTGSRSTGAMLSPSSTADKKAYQEMISDIAAVRALS